MNDFWQGAAWAFRGIGEFFRHPRLWRFVAIPLLLVAAVYGWLFYEALAVWMPRLLAATEEFFSGRWFGFLYRSAEFLITAGFYLSLAALTAFFAANVFELLGGVCFSRMVRDYEKNVLHCEIVKLSPARELANLAACGVFSTVTLIVYLIFFIAGFFLPVIAPAAMVFFVGYRYAVIYTSEAVFNSGRRLSDVGVLYQGRSGLLFGFGFVSFLIFLVPLLPIFLIPGLVLGGTLMFHHRRD